MKPLLIKHLNGEPIGRLPVWMMRQAGRYLPSYRAIRERHSFWEMVTQPNIVVEVSLLPLAVIPVDAVIFFSDILTPPYGLGIPISMKEAIGPVVETPFQTVKDFECFRKFDPTHHTAFVGTALKEIRRKMPSETALIGFAGAPWTVASYLVEGRGKTDFKKITDWHKSAPAEAEKALSELATATEAYLLYQIDSGVDCVQLFDTWLGNMSPEFFSRFYVPMLNRIFDSVKKRGVKMIYFAKKISAFLPEVHRLTADVLSIDNSLDLAEVDTILKGKYSLQGNLDPDLLLTGVPGKIRLETRLLVEKARTLKRPAIINLGHGVLPKTPVENVQAFIQEARIPWI